MLALLGSATFLETFTGILNGADIVAHCKHEHATSRYEEWLGQSSVIIYIAETYSENGPIGYFMMSESTLPIADLSADDYELKRIYLLHKFQGTGVGQALMAKAITIAKENGKKRLLLGVYSGNARAIAFYKRNGFFPVGQRRFQVGKNTYEDIVWGREIS